MLWMPHFAGCLLRVCWEGHYDNGLDNGQVRMSMKLKMLTEYPSWIQEPTIKLQVWSSNGKKATLTGQVERNLVGGGQKTRPLLWTKAKLLMYWPLKSSALQLITIFWKCDFFWHNNFLNKSGRQRFRQFWKRNQNILTSARKGKQVLWLCKINSDKINYFGSECIFLH